MHITDVQEKSVSIASAISNAYIDFSKMTVSVVAISTDVIRDGKPVIGYGFNSNGRYAQSGLLRDRFIPRLMQAETDAVLTDTKDNYDEYHHRTFSILTGSVRQNAAPCPFSLTILISPPRHRARIRAPASPRPWPLRGTMAHSLTWA